MVSCMSFGLNSLVRYILQDVPNFRGGNLKRFSENWHKYIRHPNMLEIVSSQLKLELKKCHVYFYISIPLDTKQCFRKL